MWLKWMLFAVQSVLNNQSITEADVKAVVSSVLKFAPFCKNDGGADLCTCLAIDYIKLV